MKIPPLILLALIGAVVAEFVAGHPRGRTVNVPIEFHHPKTGASHANASFVLVMTHHFALDAPLVVGGDHSMAIGTVTGVAAHFRKRDERIGLVWVDAHADMNTPESSPSGNVHGMPLASIMGYGPDALTKGTFANNCLIARRLLERGVRFVQLMHAGWDQHGNLFTQLAEQCRDTDQPSAGLVTDLRQRGLLDDTVVYWGGEFGRTPFGQGDPNKPAGRDHFGRAFSVWLAGGGVRKGHAHGETDDFAWNISRDGVHIHDMQATLLHLMGMDHERLTFRYQGRQFRLSDVHGEVVRGVLA